MTRPPEPNHDAPLDVIIVGAGAAGIGVAIALTKTFGLDSQRVEAGVGALQSRCRPDGTIPEMRAF